MNSSKSSEDATMTSEEMLDRSTSWTLACDNAILNRLQTFSDDLQRNSLEITQDCDSLGKDVTLLQAKLANVTNKFLMISNSQFVENRVQEFKEGDIIPSASGSNITTKTVEKAKTKQEKETELIGKMKEAIQLGIHCSEQRSEALSSSLTNSQRKLKLPHLIGSSKFFSSRYVGLVPDARISSNSLSGNDNFYSDSISIKSSSESNFASRNNQSMVINHHEQTTLPSQIPASVPQIPNPRLSTDTLPRSDSQIELPQPHSIPYSNNDAHHEVQTSSSAFEPSVIKPPTKQSLQYPPPYTIADVNNPHVTPGFAGPPPIDQSDESDDDFKPNSKGTGRLFVDDDDDDLFNDKSLFPPKQNDISSLFGNNSANFLSPSLSTLASVTSPPPYEDEIDVEDKSRPGNRKLTTQSDFGTLPGPISNISNRYPANTIQDQKEPTNTIHEERSNILKIPPGGVSVFGTVPPGDISKLKHKKQSIHSSQPNKQTTSPPTNSNSVKSHSSLSRVGSSQGTSEDYPQHDVQVDTASQSSLASKGMTSSQGSLNEPVRSKALDLFDSESDEDLFLSSKKQPYVSSNPSKVNSIIFSDTKTNKFLQGPPFLGQSSSSNSNKSSTILKKHSIFDDSESDDDLFSSASSTTSSTNKHKAQNTQKGNNLFNDTTTTTSSGILVKSKTLGLFGDDSDTDLFTSLNFNSKNKSSVTNEPVKNQIENHRKTLIRIMEVETDKQTTTMRATTTTSATEQHKIEVEKNESSSKIEAVSSSKEDNDSNCDKDKIESSDLHLELDSSARDIEEKQNEEIGIGDAKVVCSSPNPLETKSVTSFEETEEDKSKDQREPTSTIHEEKPSIFKIPPGGVSVFGTVPPGDISKLKHKKQSIHSPKPNKETISPSTNLNSVKSQSSLSRVGSSHETNEDYPQHDVEVDTAGLSSKGMTSSQGSLNKPVRSKALTDLPDSESDEDLFLPSKKQLVISSNPSKVNSSIFSDPKSNNSLKGPPSLGRSSSHNSNKSSTILKKHSIFDDSESDDDLFSSATSTTGKNKAQNTLEVETDKQTTTTTSAIEQEKTEVEKNESLSKKEAISPSKEEDESNCDKDKIESSDLHLELDSSARAIEEKQNEEIGICDAKDFCSSPIKTKPVNSFEEPDEDQSKVENSKFEQKSNRYPGSNLSPDSKIQDQREPTSTIHEEKQSIFKIPPGGVSIFGTVPPGEILKFKYKKQSIHSSQPNKETTSPPTNTNSVKSHSSLSSQGTSEDYPQHDVEVDTASLASKGMTSSQASLNEPVRSKALDLFDSESDEDLFLPSKKQLVISSNPSKVNSSIFSDPKSNNSLKGPPSLGRSSSHNSNKSSTVLKKHSIFDDSESDDDLFSSATSTNKHKAQNTLEVEADKQTTTTTSAIEHENTEVEKNESLSKKEIVSPSKEDESNCDKDKIESSDLHLEMDNSARAIEEKQKEEIGMGDAKIICSSPTPIETKPVASFEEPDEAQIKDQREPTSTIHEEKPSIFKIPPGGVSVFGTVPPGDISKLKYKEQSTSSHLLTSLVKGRARILSKRRAPSKKLLKSYASNEEKVLKEEVDDIE